MPQLGVVAEHCDGARHRHRVRSHRARRIATLRVVARSLDDFLKAANELVEAIRAGSDPTPKAFRQQRMSVVSPAKQNLWASASVRTTTRDDTGAGPANWTMRAACRTCCPASVVASTG